MIFLTEFRSSQRGQLLIEIVIAAGIITLAFVGFLQLQSSLLRARREGIPKAQATYRAQEALEAMRCIRDLNSWSSFTTLCVPGTDYRPDSSGGDWALALGSEVVDSIFTRKVNCATVLRDLNPVSPTYGAIVTSGGLDDSGTRKIIATVSWGQNIVTLDAYLTQWKEFVQ